MKQDDIYRSQNQQKMLDQLKYALEALEEFEDVMDEITLDPIIQRVNDVVYDAQESVINAIIEIQKARDILGDI